MVQNLYTKIALVVALLILAVYVIVAKDITLGLDLKGGSSLRYQLPATEDTTVKMIDVVEETIEVFRKRIDTIGLKEIQIRSQGEDEILIDLPGMAKSEVDNIIQIIQSQGNLEWYLLAETEHDAEAPDEAYIDVEEETKKLVAFLEEQESVKGGWNLDTDLTSLDRNVTINDRAILFRWLPMSESTLAKYERMVPDPEEGVTFADLSAGLSGTSEQIATVYFKLAKIFKDPHWRFGGVDLISVSASHDRSQMPAVGFEFKPSRAADFKEFTKSHIKKNLAIVLDGKIVTDPVIESELPGSGIISGPPPKGFLPHEQKALLTVLRSGSITVKPVLLSRHDIGPTLGENSINRGKLAAVIGLSMVFAFIIAYYFLAGVVASISLAINLTLLMGVLIFLEMTLTLPGIAGIVLTVGMAVDANILIFERIREEKDKGKTIFQSVKNGFEKAFLTIVDANATTFITGFILYHFGTGPIKGFAVTLMVGILTSLFSALIISKVIFALMIEKGLSKLNMYRFLRESAIDFLSLRRRGAVLSIVLIIIGLVIFFMEDDRKYGLDFTGGYNVHLVCKEGTTQADVQTSLGAEFPNVQVISVATAESQALGAPQIFNVKIKSVALPNAETTPSTETPGEGDIFEGQAGEEPGGDERLPQEEENPQEEPTKEPAAGEETPPAAVEETEPAMDTSVATTPSAEEASSIEIQTDYYLSRIRAILGDKVLEDPIANLVLIHDPDTETTAIRAQLHFVRPPATDQQIQARGDLTPEQVYEQNIRTALGTFVEPKTLTFSNGGLMLDLEAVYKQPGRVSDGRIRAGLINQFKAAQAQGIPVELSDPFPMTDYIGPTVGTELRDKAIIAIFFSLVAIIIYIRFRFKEYKFGIAACVALVHDVLITLGAVAFIRLTGLVDIEIDLPIIAAFLTIIGYSLNDTIVVFDRIRENQPRMNKPFGEIINISINQTLSRTILTSLTTLLTVSTLFAINYGQRNVLEGFSFAMIIGVIVGTYSSIFVASPVLFLISQRSEAKARVK